jgi:hypothetical protein
MKRAHIVLGSASLLLLSLGALASGCAGSESDPRAEAPPLTPALAQSISLVSATPTETDGTVNLAAVVMVGTGATYTMTGTVTSAGHDITLSDGLGNSYHDATSTSLQDLTSTDAQYNHRVTTSGDITATLDAAPVALSDALAAAQAGVFGDQPLVGTELNTLAAPATTAGLSPAGKALVAQALARISAAVVTFAGPAPAYPSGDAALPPEPAPGSTVAAACTAVPTTTTAPASAPPIQPQGLGCTRTCNLPDAKSANAGSISLDLGNGLKVSGSGPVAQHAATFWSDAKLPLITARQGFTPGTPSTGACRCTLQGITGSGSCTFSRNSFTAYAYTDSSSSVCAAGADMPDKAAIYDLSVTAPGTTVALKDSCSGNLTNYAHAYAQATITGCYDTSGWFPHYTWVSVGSLTKKTRCA